MDIELCEAKLSDKAILQNMLELYQHDASEYDGKDLDEHGRYGYRYLDYYWVEANRVPFLVRVDGKLAGFALVNEHLIKTGEAGLSVAEIFIVRKYRRCGVGTTVARQLFDRFAATWEVRQEAGNIVAQAFWRKVINTYTAGNYTEYPEGMADWGGPIQIFASKKYVLSDKG